MRPITKAVFSRDILILILCTFLVIIGELTRNKIFAGLGVSIYGFVGVAYFIQLWRIATRPPVRTPFSPPGPLKRKITLTTIGILLMTGICIIIVFIFSTLIFLGKVKY